VAPADVASTSHGRRIGGQLSQYGERRLPVVIGPRMVGAGPPRFAPRPSGRAWASCASANFSIGVEHLPAGRQRGARLMSQQAQYGAWMPRAAPHDEAGCALGTALLLRDSMQTSGYERASTCRPREPHRFPARTSWDSTEPSDTIQLSHAARDRRGFAGAHSSPRAGFRAAGVVHGWPTSCNVVDHPGRPASRRRTKPRGRICQERLSCALRLQVSAPRSSRRSRRRFARRGAITRLTDGRSTRVCTSCRPAGRPRGATLSHREKLRVVELVVEETAAACPCSGAGG